MDGPWISTLLGMGVAAAVGAGFLCEASKLHEDEKAANTFVDDEEDYATDKSTYSCEVK